MAETPSKRSDQLIRGPKIIALASFIRFAPRRNVVGSGGWISAIDSCRRTTWIADPHRDGKRFAVRFDEKLIAFLELESAICACGEYNYIKIRLVLTRRTPTTALWLVACANLERCVPALSGFTKCWAFLRYTLRLTLGRFTYQTRLRNTVQTCVALLRAFRSHGKCSDESRKIFVTNFGFKFDRPICAKASCDWIGRIQFRG